MVKYAAMTLGILLAAAIIGGIATLLLKLADFTGGRKMDKIDFNQEFSSEEIRSLDFDNQDGTMKIVAGNEFSVEGKNVPESFVAKIENHTLVVAYTEEKQWKLFGWGGNDFSDAEITITVPREFYGEEIDISNGSGELEFGSLSAGEISLDNGSGRLEFEAVTADNIEIDNGSGELEVREAKASEFELSAASGAVLIKQITAVRAKIDSGSGNVSVEVAALKGLELSSGSGDFELAGQIDGDLTVDSGSGKVTFTLQNSRKEYNITADTGSGALWLDGQKLEDYKENNSGAEYNIRIDSGSGRVAIEFLKED